MAEETKSEEKKKVKKVKPVVAAVVLKKKVKKVKQKVEEPTASPEKKKKKKVKVDGDKPKKSNKKSPGDKSERVVRSVTPDAVIDPGAGLPATHPYADLTGKAAVAEAKRLHGALSKDFAAFSAILFKIRVEESYKDAEHGTWESFCEAEFGFSVRTANNRLRAYKVLQIENKVNTETMEALGRSKCETLAEAIEKGHIGISEIPQFIEIGLKGTEDTLKAAIKTHRSQPIPGEDEDEDSEEPDNEEASEDNGEKKVVAGENLTARLTADQVKLYKQTMKSVQKVKGDRKISANEFIESLCLNYQASTIKESEKEASYYIRLMNQSFPKLMFFALPQEYAEKVREFTSALAKKVPNKKSEAAKDAKAKQKKAKEAPATEDPAKKKLKKKKKVKATSEE